jgi:hypothetical protein
VWEVEVRWVVVRVACEGSRWLIVLMKEEHWVEDKSQLRVFIREKSHPLTAF